MCDPTWTVAQSIRFVISKLCRYAVRQDGSVRVYSAPVTARAEQIAKMRYGADARCDGQTADGMEYPAIAGTIGLSRIGAQGYVLTLAKIARRTTITMPAFERLARTGAPFYRSREDERDAQAIRGEHLAQSDVARFIREILSPATPYTPATKTPALAGSKSVRAIERRRELLAAAAREQEAEHGAACMPDIVVLGRARRADDAEVAALPVWFSSIDGFESRGSEAGGWFWPGGAPPETSLLHAVARRVLSVAQRPVPLQDLEAALTGARRFTAGVRRSARIEALPLLAVERLASRMHDLHVDAGRVAARVTLDAAVELPTPDRQIFEEALSHGGGLTMQTGAPRGWLDHRRWLAHLLPMVAHVGDFRTARASGQWACATASPTRRRAKG